MVIAIFASNIGITPISAPVYDVVMAQFVPVGIVLLLLNSRLRVIFVEARPVLVSFVVACLATLAGVAVAVAAMDLGAIEASAAGVFAATYIGGAMNFVAVSQSLGFTDPDIYAGALAADTVVGALFFMVLMILAGLLTKRGEEGGTVAVKKPEQASEGLPADRAGRLALAVGTAFLVSWIASELAVWFGIPGFSILFLTIITVAAANIFPDQIARLKGVEEVGIAIMYGFFVVVGFGADFGALSGSALQFLGFAAIIVCTHLVVVLGCAFLFRMPMREMLVASNAAVLGPATAAGMAGAREWSSLVTPGLFAGILGYIVANFIGVGVAMLLGWS